MSDQDDKNVVKLSDARKRQRTLKGASSGNGHAAGRFGMGQGQNQKKPQNAGFAGGQSKFWTVLQFIIFMALVAFVLSECGSHGP